RQVSQSPFALQGILHRVLSLTLRWHGSALRSTSTLSAFPSQPLAVAIFFPAQYGSHTLYSRACPGPVTHTPSRVSLHSPPGGELWPDFHRLECCRVVSLYLADKSPS